MDFLKKCKFLASNEFPEPHSIYSNIQTEALLMQYAPCCFIIKPSGVLRNKYTNLQANKTRGERFIEEHLAI